MLQRHGVIDKGGGTSQMGEKKTVELAKTVEEREVHLSKRKAQDRKRASEFHASETAAQREVTYSKL